MSEVERYWIDPSRLVQGGWHQDDTCVVKDWAYDRVVAEREALQQRLTAADERADELEGLLRRSRQFTIDIKNPVQLREDISAALKPAEAARCCTVSAEDRALLEAGDYTPEELFGIGGKPSCPKCAKP